MRMGIRWFLWVTVIFLIPTAGFAQPVPPVIFTGPLSNPRPESGGLYVGAEFLYMCTNRTLQYQAIAYRGFLDRDGKASDSPPNTWVGTHDVALSTGDVMGPGQYQPGYNIYVGWKFEGGVAVELGWTHLTPVRYHAGASILPPDGNNGFFFENTFVSSPVVNFSSDWAGAQPRLTQGTAASTFGIWDAATVMNLTFTQKYDVYTVNARVPIWETADMRTYGLFGPRIVWIVDRFDWLTISEDKLGNYGPDTTALYSNTVSNRMYGVHFGAGNDWFLGSTPIGGFAFNLDVEGGLYVDLVKTTANYNRGDGLVSAGRSGRLSSIVPSAEVSAGLKWYVWEGITIDLGYNIQTYFNTLASPRPVDFNLGSVDPTYDHMFFRWFYGMRFGITFSF
jgi:hypothetical protein